MARHCVARWRQPLRAHSRAAFEAVQGHADSFGRIILDSGCGTGHSTATLAKGDPDSLVIGVDKSLHRLAKAPEQPDNAVLVRADLSDFWRLAADAGWRLKAHYLLYPTPWPKARHLQRRWHGHPVFPSLLALGGRIELRSNFKLYIDEFEQALGVAGVSAAEVVSFSPDIAISPFEQKYLTSGHDLYRLKVNLETT